MLSDKNPVEGDLNCPICENADESDWHVLFECAERRRAWQTAGLEEFLPQMSQQANSTAAGIRSICRDADNFIAGKVAMLIWVLWNNRNNWVWNNTKESGQQLGYKAKCLWNEWNEVQNVRGSTRERQQQVQHWQKPQQQWYKCNVDAGFQQQWYICNSRKLLD
ncbi:hypothetical protein L195_g049000 [Trifolium pratense]|uniref:Reverse transcriptase zinc-binding domain-containing protein n=1 Tax=Trifolium pratense TaxID=57577 RepID=A0A2K3JMV3_TRIPR|nr:hypothetical protein L195_g049000 [Trifolium pratense]